MDLKIKEGQSARVQIAEYYRKRIRLGKLSPGERLPSARQIASLLNATESNVHHALSTLAREGLIDRCQKTGTIVLSPGKPLHSVAVYVTLLPLQRGEEFTRLLISFISEALEKNHISCHIIYETPSGNGKIQLKQLVSERRIQGVIARNISKSDLPFFKSLGVHFTGISTLRILNKVNIGDIELGRKILEAMKSSGAKSFGIITSLSLSENPQMLEYLRQNGAKAGMTLRDEWVYDGHRSPVFPVIDDARFAWKAYEYFRELPQRPNGLMLFSDALISGLTMAFYHYGVRVPDDYKLVIHHTRENPVIFPFECKLVQHSIAEIANTLVEQIIDLSVGKTPRQSKLSIRIKDENVENISQSSR
jgi:DNA-binding LacI/PurR family transcriptional regulator